jgi:glyoxylase-like metal-dependent hydrolase (beta-lactamase superfamily II)
MGSVPAKGRITDRRIMENVIVNKKIGFLLVLLLFVGAAYFYLFRYNALGGYGTTAAHAGYSVDWDKVRALAGSEGPIAVHSEKIADGEFYGWMLEAGGDWNRLPMEFRTFQLVYANGDTIMIDAIHDHKLHSSMAMMLGYDDEAFAHQLQGMREAKTIIVTHEHFDHINGLLSVINEDDVAKKMFIPAAQRNSPRIREAGFDDAALAKLPPVDYQGMHQLAPGVVLIAAPGHTFGNQIVYVRLTDGNEYAFIGDIAWNARNYRNHLPKTVIMNLVAHEDAELLNPQIAYFADLIPTSPMHFVIAHDPEWTQDQIARGLIKPGLVLKTQAGAAETAPAAIAPAG